MFKELVTTDRELVDIAIGCEKGYWYVQTTDREELEGVYLSEGIAENLSTKEEALEIACNYIYKYGFRLQEWNR